MAMHRINRLEVELYSDEAALARALSDRVSRMHGDRIAPVLDRVCSELGGSEALFRLDRLELDLGTLAADEFEGAFGKRLEPALRAALARALERQTAGDGRAQASLEVLETFALTGSLPWWTPQDGDVVAHHFARAAAEAEAELVMLLARIAHDPGALDRIARTCDRGALVALAERAQGSPQLPRSVAQNLLSSLTATGGPRQPAARPPAEHEPDDPSAAHTTRPALDDARHDGDRPGVRPPDEPAPLDGGTSAVPGTAAEVPPSEHEPDDPDAAYAAGPAPAGARHGGDGPGVRPPDESTPLDRQPSPVPGIAAGVPPSEHEPADPGTAHAAGPAPGGSERGQAAHPPIGDARIEPQRLAPLDGRRPPALGPLGPALRVPPRIATGTRRAPLAPAAPATIRAARRGALARLDELYVEDAGLVILWPFFERFFARTGLVGRGRSFLDEAAQLQAVALAELLATSDPAPPEFRLPLAKLLCGRPFESDFALDRPLTPEQIAEADRLLAAVIDRAAVLGELSIPGFRAGFLARPGSLGTRDGAWLLQVERRPHDAVLDRFPWSWGWVKLPWMPEPLRVEW